MISGLLTRCRAGIRAAYSAEATSFTELPVFPQKLKANSISQISSVLKRVKEMIWRACSHDARQLQIIIIIVIILHILVKEINMSGGSYTADEAVVA